MHSNRLERITDVLKRKILVCDGAMGTMLFEKGIKVGSCCEMANLDNPQLVYDIHKAYVENGAEMIETNTFGANRAKLSLHKLENVIGDINRRAVEIGRQAAGDSVYVAGSIGPTGRVLEPYGILSKAECYDIFHEQAGYLLSAGVDVIIIETMSDLEEALLALKAVKDIDGEIPVICQMAFMQDGKTFMGVDARTAVIALADAGADIVGANCGTGIAPLVDVIRSMKAAKDIFISVQPNAGLPRLVEGRTVYESTPEYFGESVPLFVKAGANIVGGCCGTTPRHIKVISETVAKLRVPLQQKIELVSDEDEELVPRDDFSERKSEFCDKLGREFVLTVEIDPPKGTGLSKVLAGVKALKDAGIDAINISDSPMARVRLSPIAIAHVLKERLGVESILHFTCRDRNLLGIQSELLGASVLGINNVLALTGDPPAIGDHPTAKPVFDVDSEGLVRILATLNAGADLAGNALNQPTNFCIGVAANPRAADFGKELSRLEKKLEAGAHFIQTQPIYDISVLEEFMERIRHLNTPVIVGVLPLRNAKHAEFLHNEVPGMIIPADIRDRMHKVDPEKAMDLGIEIACEFLVEARDVVEGAYLMPPFGRYEMAIKILERLK